MKKFYVPLLAVFFVLLIAPAASAQLAPATMRQIQSLLNEKQLRTPVQRKIDSRLLQAVREARGDKMADDVMLEAAVVNAEKSGILKVDIKGVITDELIRKIEAVGGSVIYASPRYGTVRAEIGLSRVETIAAYPEVKFIEPAAEAITVGSSRTGRANPLKSPGLLSAKNKHAASGPRLTFAERSARVKTTLENYLYGPTNKYFAPFTGTVNAQGDLTHRANEVRSNFGYAGQGIRIGVLSDSYNALGGAPADIANGNLPGPGNPLGNTLPVTVLADLAGGTDEGRAMLQIVHDIAPKAQLFFATASLGEASFATNIQALRNAPYNCDIIIDDIFYTTEPAFQDGIIAQAVNSVTASGAWYFASAGNAGSIAKGTAGVWEGDFNDTGSPVFSGSTKLGTIHNFGTATAPVNGDIILATGNRYTLKWTDPAGASGNDYDLFLVSAAGAVKASSTNIQSGTQQPYEDIVPLTLVAGDRLVVFKSANAQIKAFSLNTVRGRLTVATTGQTHGHSAAINAFSVSATPAATPFTSTAVPGPYPGAFTTANKVETFNSDGPRRVFFNADGTAITPGNFLFGTNGGNVRNKPDITAADGVATTLAGGLNPFYGTSAAAPHAGAIAALLRSANPALTLAQFRNILTATAVDIENPGYDNLSGYGIVQAYQAMQALNPTPQAALDLGTVTATESGFSNNNSVIDPGEIASIVVQLRNTSPASAINAVGTITTSTPGVTIVRGTALFGTVPASGSSGNNGTPFIIGINKSVACGTTINLGLIVSFSGGSSPVGFQLTVPVGSQAGTSISSTLGSAPPANPGFTAITGLQNGRIARLTPAVSCGISKAVSLNDTLSGRAFDAYTFTNITPSSLCITVTLNSPGGINLYAVAYNDSGFVPSDPRLHFIADQGSSAALQTFGFTAAAGKSFTLVVHAVTPGAAVGTAYTLSTSFSTCGVSPACTPVVVSTTNIASGVTGSPYTQSFAATGGSGSGYFAYALLGNLPAGLSFTGSTLTGTPTQAGSFPVRLVVTDPVGCPADTVNYTLNIAGRRPFVVTATYGTPQSAYPGNSFSQTFQATVKDSAGNLLPGVNVIFTAPATGASGSFPGGVQTITVVTNSNGVATAPVFTANATAGNYVVSATVAGVSTPAAYNLSNFCPASFVVTSSDDSGPGTLREVIATACAGTTITFDPRINLILLTSGELPITKGVTILGPGTDKLTISGTNSSRIFNITAGTATVNISGLTLRDGRPPASSANGGGAILIANGAGIGAVNISRCAISGNDVSLPGNALGGAIDNEGGTVSIDQCALVNNIATFRGGAVQNQGFGSMTITNTTIAGNTAGPAGLGGGIRSFLPLTLTNCTIFGNSALSGGNISVAGNTLTFKNTIIAGGTLIGSGGTGPDINGTGFQSADYNLIENTAAGTVTGITAHNLTGIKPNLLPLGYYSSLMPALLPRSNSPVINTGDSLLVSGTDQRGLPRLVGRRADIGAVETNYAFVASSGTPQTTGITRPFPLLLQARITESGTPVAGDTLFFLAPSAGASGTFPGASLSAFAVSNSAGLATSPLFTANSIAGRYNVTGRIGVEFPVINYDLTNAAGGPLPVVFGAISAKAVNCQVELNWKTLTEQSAKDYIIEYSRDGVVFTDLATIPARGSGTTAQQYKWVHTSPAEGVTYYRIRQTDISGAYTLGDVMQVANNCSSAVMKAYPNPVRSTLIVQIGGSGKHVLSVYDALGRQMVGASVNAGRHEINVVGWAKGLYTLTLTREGKSVYTTKIIKD